MDPDLIRRSKVLLDRIARNMDRHRSRLTMMLAEWDDRIARARAMNDRAKDAGDEELKIHSAMFLEFAEKERAYLLAQVERMSTP